VQQFRRERALDDDLAELEEDDGPPPIDPTTREGRLEGGIRIAKVFTPAAPVSDFDLFADVDSRGRKRRLAHAPLPRR